MLFEFREQELAVQAIAEVRGIVPVCLPLPSGAVEILAGVPHRPEMAHRITIHVDGSATPEGGRTVPVTEVLEHGC